QNRDSGSPMEPVPGSFSARYEEDRNRLSRSRPSLPWDHAYQPTSMLSYRRDGTTSDKREMERARAELERADEMWAAAAAAGRDIAQIVDLWADDAILTPPGH